jgi:type III secretory pathway component EscV
LNLTSRVLDHVAAFLEVPNASPLDLEELDRIRATIRARVERGASSLGVAILTSSSVRFFVRELIADELPEVPVFSYEEVDLGLDLAIQNLGVITA